MGVIFVIPMAARFVTVSSKASRSGIPIKAWIRGIARRQNSHRRDIGLHGPFPEQTLVNITFAVGA